MSEKQDLENGSKQNGISVEENLVLHDKHYTDDFLQENFMEGVRLAIANYPHDYGEDTSKWPKTVYKGESFCKEVGNVLSKGFPEKDGWHLDVFPRIQCDENDLYVPIFEMKKKDSDQFVKMVGEYYAWGGGGRITLSANLDDESLKLLDNNINSEEFKKIGFNSVSLDKYRSDNQKTVDMSDGKDNAFGLLSPKQKTLVTAIQKWAKDNDVRNDKGYLLSFNGKSKNPQAALNALVKQAKAKGFVPKQKDNGKEI